MVTLSTRLRFQPDRTSLRAGDGPELVLATSPAALAAAVLRHDPAAAVELEAAIDEIENALMAARAPRAGGALLVTDEPWLRALPGLEAPGSCLDREAVEALFDRLARRALGDPAAGFGLPAGREPAGALVILRELMHHLDYARVCADGP